jgi:hypothetical protein
MNTIMETKIKEAFQEWKQADKPEEKTMSATQKLTGFLIDMIKAKPGITGKELRIHVAQSMPEVTESYVPALMKGLYDKNMVSRELIPAQGFNGRDTYAYTVIPEEMRDKLPKKEKVKAYTKKQKAAPQESKGIATLIPAERAERMVTAPANIGATTVYITIRTGGETTYSLRLEEAKVIYQQLNQIFGGVR